MAHAERTRRDKDQFESNAPAKVHDSCGRLGLWQSGARQRRSCCVMPVMG